MPSEQVEAPAGPLFADESVSDALLKGEEAPADGDKKPVEKGTEPPPPAGEAPTKELTAEEKAEAEKKAAEGKDKQPIPLTPEIKAIVDKEAAKATEGIRNELIQTRTKAREIVTQLEAKDQTIAELQTALAERTAKDTTPDEDARWKDFTVKTKEEFAAMDLEEQQSYLLDRADYLDYENRKKEQSRRQKAAEETRKLSASRWAGIIKSSQDELAQVIPGIFDENNDTSEKIIGFASEHGMDPDLLMALSDPGTYIQVRGDDGKYARPALLGRGSVSVVKALHGLYSKVTSDVEAMRQQIREEVTQELTKKFTETGLHDGVGDLPSARTTIADTSQIVTEDQLRAADEAQQRKFLGG
jgi:hypothetical protein